MTTFRTSLRFSPYLFDDAGEPKTWVTPVGDVSTFGQPLDGFLWMDCPDETCVEDGDSAPEVPSDALPVDWLLGRGLPDTHS